VRSNLYHVTKFRARDAVDISYMEMNVTFSLLKIASGELEGVMPIFTKVIVLTEHSGLFCLFAAHCKGNCSIKFGYFCLKLD